LQIVAVLLEQSIETLILWNVQEFEIRQGRQFSGRAHKGPDDASLNDTWIAWMPDVALELLLGRDVRHVDALPASGVFPAVVRAAQSILLNSAKE
jgi:hypothetical protein